MASIIPQSSIGWGNPTQGKPLPYMKLTGVSAPRGLHMNGVNNVQPHRVQVDIYTATYKDCKLVSRALNVALNGYRQDNFRLIEDDGARDLGLQMEKVEDDSPYRITHDFLINWRP